MLTKDAQELELQTLDFSKTVDIAAPLDITWEAVLLELGPESAIGEVKPSKYAVTTAPRAAPLVVPVRSGEASGLANKAWIAAPLAPSIAP